MFFWQVALLDISQFFNNFRTQQLISVVSSFKDYPRNYELFSQTFLIEITFYLKKQDTNTLLSRIRQRFTVFHLFAYLFIRLIFHSFSYPLILLLSYSLIFVSANSSFRSLDCTLLAFSLIHLFMNKLHL